MKKCYYVDVKEDGTVAVGVLTDQGEASRSEDNSKDWDNATSEELKSLKEVVASIVAGEEV